MRSWLVDTGPLVAYLDSSDPEHQKVGRVWDGYSGRLFTTSAVITEAIYFVSDSPDGAMYLADLATASSLEIFDLTQPPELHQTSVLMKKYADIPMDFADATLVLLAEAIEVYDILTLDRRGFSAFRTRKNQSFQNVMDLAV